MYEYHGKYVIRKQGNGFVILDKESGQRVAGTGVYPDLQTAKAVVQGLPK